MVYQLQYQATTFQACQINTLFMNGFNVVLALFSSNQGFHFFVASDECRQCDKTIGYR